MTNASIYILTNGQDSKAGISTNVDTRMQAYRTHNPDFKLHTIRQGISIEDARRVESIVKACFKHVPSNTGKEWFQVSAEHMTRVVDFHLQPLRSNKDTSAIAAGDVPLSMAARDALDSIASDRDKTDARYRVMDAFSAAFNLGIPAHKLPEDTVVKERFLPVDIAHCDSSHPFLQERIQGRTHGMQADDHLYRFYHLVELNSGYTVALCTSYVSMPYLERLADMSEILDKSEACGLRVFRQDQWAWWFPNRTGLLLYVQKTPVIDRLNAWEGSFRKWVIENSKALEMRTGHTNQIEDVTHDPTFPMHVTCWNDLLDGYLKRFYGLGEDTANFLRPKYEHLFRLWGESPLQ